MSSEESKKADEGVGMEQGRRANESTGPRMDSSEQRLIGGDSFIAREANPAWLQKRDEIYAAIRSRREEELSKKTPVEITVTMPDGKVISEDKEGVKFLSWKTSPYDVAVTISQGLADAATVARVTYEKFVDDYSPSEDGMEGQDTLMDAMADLSINDESSGKTMLWDMTRPLVGPVSKLEFCKFDDDRDAKTVFWHSSAHMLGEALEHLYGCKLTIGPPLAGGFYYDSYMGKDAFKEDDCKFISAIDRHCLTCRIQLLLTSFIYIHLVICFFAVQTNRSSKKSTRSSKKSKSLSAWL